MLNCILRFILIEIVFRTTVHQTLEDRNNVDYIEDHGPFPVRDIKNSYLGAGTYFWDDHIELAHWWGRIRIKGAYVVCEGKLEVGRNDFFDLVGSRQDMIHLRELVSTFNLGDLSLGEIIEYLKGIARNPGKEGIFPFKVIRVLDSSTTSYEQEWIKFSDNRNGITSLSPIYIICLIGKTNLYLRSYRVIYPESYSQDV